MSQPPQLTPHQLQSLNLFCRAVSSSKNLRKWFTSLGTLSPNLRMNAIMQITTEMRREQEDLGLIGAICSLSDHDVYAAAKHAVDDL
ncbi:MAG: hypothetical protein ORN83_07785 [Chthoniobacteraceae bacterium]|jgi:hypothetical protein|nr:hypothetical protein [Chthoniobacteraceae bacterium]